MICARCRQPAKRSTATMKIGNTVVPVDTDKYVHTTVYDYLNCGTYADPIPDPEDLPLHLTED